MTKPNNEPQDEEQQAVAGQPGPDAAAVQQDSDSDEPQSNPGDEPDPRNAEAAKHRHRAKAAEDGLAVARTLLEDQGSQINALQRQVVDARISHAFADPADFHRDVSLADVLGDDGAVDLAKVDAAAQKVLADHPHYRRNAYAPVAAPASVVTTNTPTTVVPGGQKASWSDVLTQGSKLD